jgi:sodium-dependent dicarboxylate transporter 2/3/5
MESMSSEKTLKENKHGVSKNTIKAWIGIFLAVVLVLASRWIAIPEGVTREGAYALALFLAAIILWITEAMPMSVVNFALMAIIPFFGIMDLKTVLSNFGGIAFFFVIATYAITYAVSRTTIPLRISSTLIKWSKGDSRKLVIGFAFATAITSSIMSNLATCILYLGLVQALLRANNSKPGESNLGKCLMIIIPACSGVGGFITPAGTPGNVLVISMLSNVGIEIGFLQWTILAAPLALLTVLICGLWITAIFKPEPISQEAAAVLEAKRAELGAMSTQEKKTVIIVLTMVIAWFAGTWVSFLNTTVVALIGMAILFLPGINVISWNDFAKETNWNIVFTIGSIGVLIAGLISTGIMNWIVTTVFSGITGWSTFALFLFVGFIVCVIRAFVPTAPAVIALFGVPLLAIAEMTGQSAVALIFIPAYWACTPMLLWFEPIFLFTYGEGYYTPMDVLKYGSVPSVIMVLVMTLLPAFVGIVGF